MRGVEIDCAGRNWLVFSVVIDWLGFGVGGRNWLGFFMPAANRLVLVWASKLTWFLCWWLKLTWFQRGRSILFKPTKEVRASNLSQGWLSISQCFILCKRTKEVRGSNPTEVVFPIFLEYISISAQQPGPMQNSLKNPLISLVYYIPVSYTHLTLPTKA